GPPKELASVTSPRDKDVQNRRWSNTAACAHKTIAFIEGIVMNVLRTPLGWTLRLAALGAIAVLVCSLNLSKAQAPGSAQAMQSAMPGAGAENLAPESPTITSKNLLGIIHDGGWVMYPLLFCSFILMVFAFERSISLRSGRVIPRPFVKRIMHQLEEEQLDRDEARLVCEENGSPAAKIFAAAARKWGRPAVEVEQAVIDAG